MSTSAIAQIEVSAEILALPVERTVMSGDHNGHLSLPPTRTGRPHIPAHLAAYLVLRGFLLRACGGVPLRFSHTRPPRTSSSNSYVHRLFLMATKSSPRWQASTVGFWLADWFYRGGGSCSRLPIMPLGSRRQLSYFWRAALSGL